MKRHPPRAETSTSSPALPGNQSRLEEIFGRSPPPMNVRVTARLRQLPVLRESRWWRSCCDRLASSRLLPHEGTFTYRRTGRTWTLRFNGRNGQFEALHNPLYHHGYEPETGLLLARLNSGAAVFYDIGSNWGYFSLLVAAAPDFAGEIHAFEPNPATFADLVSLLESAELQSTVTPHALALGDRAARATLRSSGQFLSGLAGVTTKAGGPISVTRLDDLEIPAPTCIKLDVEGMEAAVLGGAGRVLQTARPHIVCENFLDQAAPERTLEPLELLEAARYRLFVPALGPDFGGRPLLTGYWTHVPSLLAAHPSPPVYLKPMRARERFLFGHHLNIFGCPEEKVARLDSIPGLKLTDNANA